MKKHFLLILSLALLAGCAARPNLENTESSTGLGSSPFSVGGRFTAANANAINNAVNDNDTRLDTIEALTGPVFSDGDGTYTDMSAISSTELGYLNGVTSAIQTQLDSKFSATGDLDPDQLTGDSSDNNLVDGDIVSPASTGYIGVSSSGSGDPAEGTVTFTASVSPASVAVNCQDSDGCTMTMSETGAIDGMRLRVFSHTSSIANLTFATSSGVQSVRAARAIEPGESIEFEYRTDIWNEVGESTGSAGFISTGDYTPTGTWDWSGVNGASTWPTDLSSRGTEGITIQTFTASDATPDVTNGGTSVVRFWRVDSSTTPTITDFDDGDDHSEFSNGDWFVVYVDYPATFKFSNKANIIGNADTDWSGLASNPMYLYFRFTGSAWHVQNLNTGMSDPVTLSVGGIFQKSHTITTAEGTHDGGNDAATLSASGESFPVDEYIGMSLYNVTDGSGCTVSDNDSTTQTCALSGGTDNDWDTGDVWAVSPGPNQSGSIFYIGSATTILHPAIANYAVEYHSTGANTVKVDPQSGSMVITLYGTALTAGYEIDSAGGAGDFIWLHNVSTTSAISHGSSGTWVDGGAS